MQCLIRRTPDLSALVDVRPSRALVTQRLFMRRLSALEEQNESITPDLFERIFAEISRGIADRYANQETPAQRVSLRAEAIAPWLNKRRMRSANDRAFLIEGCRLILGGEVNVELTSALRAYYSERISIAQDILSSMDIGTKGQFTTKETSR